MSRSLALVLLLAAAAPASAAKLTVAQLSKAEKAQYQTLLGQPDAQELVESFLETRGFLRDCQSVLDRKLPAAQLPFKPERFTDEYVSEAEKKTIRTAQYLSLIAPPGAGMKA